MEFSELALLEVIVFLKDLELILILSSLLLYLIQLSAQDIIIQLGALILILEVHILVINGLKLQFGLFGGLELRSDLDLSNEFVVEDQWEPVLASFVEHEGRHLDDADTNKIILNPTLFPDSKCHLVLWALDINLEFILCPLWVLALGWCGHTSIAFEFKVCK